MKIECTPQELKELLNKETPVAGTTDAHIVADMVNQSLSSFLSKV